MELSPKEFVGRSLTIVEDASIVRLQALGRPASRRQLPDSRAILGYLLDNRDALFPEEVAKRDARSYIHELMSVRNKWAHSDPLDSDDAYRAADTVARLLKLLGSEERAAESLRRELRASQAQEAVYQDRHGEPRPRAGDMSRVVIIACSKTKLSTAAPAINLYTGPLFTTSVEVAKQEGRPILVFSTRYGLLDPADVIEPYDLSYEAMTPSERERLTTILRQQFQPFVAAGLREALVLGGGNYRSLIQEALRNSGVRVEEHPKWKQVYKPFYRR